MFYDMPLLKILNVSERPRTGVVLCSSKFFDKKLVVEKRTRKYAFQQLAGVFCTRLVVSNPPRMAVVPNSSDVFAGKARRSGMCKDAHSPNNGIHVKKSKQLPAVLSREETAKIFSLLPRND